jgi:hypothetical protein
MNNPQVVAFSGGKDSTAVALRMAERGEDFDLLFNVVGGEFKSLLDHVARVAALVGKTLHATDPGFSLKGLIEGYESLPSHRMRWCTRQLKIEPTKAWLLTHPGTVLCVGLRADEEAREGGLYGEDVTYRCPLREWGWGLAEVEGYLGVRGVLIPRRTDCPLCYDQRLSEWYALWHDHPDLWEEGERLEALTGHTFRSPGAGKFPHRMADMRAAFEAGRLPRGVLALPLFDDYDVKASSRRCRVCTL